MPEVNFEWVKQQLEAAKVKVGSGKAILKLLELWNTLPELSPAMQKETLEVFSKLASGFVFLSPNEEDAGVWVPVQPGNVKVGDVVRVAADAFDANLGPTHNGRVGKVVGVRYGDVIVNSTDNKQPTLSGVHYSPYKLEKKVK